MQYIMWVVWQALSKASRSIFYSKFRDTYRRNNISMTKYVFLENPFGLRGYRKNILPFIILNKFFHKLGLHWDSCGRLVSFKSCYGVINNDCIVCSVCYERSIHV